MGIFAVPVAAHHGHDHNEARTAQQREENKEVRQERRQGKLDDARKRICESRVKNVERIMNKAATQGQKHLEVFNKISNRVQEFYANRGLAVDNYDTLIANVSAKKVAAEVAITAVKDNTTTFNCSGENPIGTADMFSGKIRAMHVALKEYRTAIKDVLVAVKTANAARVEGER